MSGEFESVSTGVAAHIGNHADAVRIPAGAEVIYTSGTPEEATQAWRNVEDTLGRAGAGTAIGDQTRTCVHVCRDSGADAAQHPRAGRSHCHPTRHLTMDRFALATFEINSAISILRHDNQE
jgi:hypothetical protein